VITVRPDATEVDVLEEVVHRAQLDHPVWGPRQRDLHEQLHRWEQLTDHDKLQVHRQKLDLEIDAHYAVIERLEGRSGGDPATLERLGEAQEELVHLHELRERGRSEAPEQLPYLFSKGPSSRKENFAEVHQSDLIGARWGAETEGLATGLGYRVRVDGEAVRLEGSSSQVRLSVVDGVVVDARNREVLSDVLGRPVRDPAVTQRLRQLGYIVRRDGSIARPPGQRHDYVYLTTDTHGLVTDQPRVRTFAERQADGAAEFQGTVDQLDEGATSAQRAQALASKLAGSKGSMSGAWLLHAVDEGRLTPGDAMLLGRYAPTLDKLGLGYAHFDGVPTSASGALDEKAYQAFYRHVRREVLDDLPGVQRGSASPYADQVSRLREHISVYPVKAKGRLFECYREMRFAEMGFTPSEELTGAGNQLLLEPEAMQILRAEGTTTSRRPDGVLQVEDVEDLIMTRPETRAFVSEGTWAIDDKTGKRAFKLEQARDYAQQEEYDGVVFFFSSEEEARSAIATVVNAGNKDDSMAIAALNEERLVFLYLDQHGQILRKSP